VSELPGWAARMRRERETRGWTQARAVTAMRTHSSKPLPEDMLRQWKRWESGRHRPGDDYRPVIAAMFGTVTAAFFDDEPARALGIPDRHAQLVSATGMDTLEIIERLRRTDLGSGTLEAVQFKADQLCAEYAYLPTDQLKREGRAWLDRITELLRGRLSLREHREILVTAGWLSLLVGCVEYDSGDTRGAEATRLAALQLGQEAEHPEIVAWAEEMKAWQALTSGRYQQVISAARAGREATGTHSVAVQLAAQEAKAWARIGDRRMVEAALDQGRTLLEALPYPDNPDHHFVVDPDKFDFYAMDCYRRVGEDHLAEIYAQEVVRKSTAPDGTERSPMRIAEARLTLGVTAARRGDLDAAQAAGAQALTASNRKSLPSLIMVASELRDDMTARAPEANQTRMFRDLLATVARST
jgi:transcriptional regulator with XRE-family HTH domain